MDITALFEKMLILFFALAAGYVAAKAGVINETSNKGFSALIANLTNPLQVIASVTAGEVLLSRTDALVLVAVAMCVYAFLIPTSALVPKLLRTSGTDSQVFRFMYIFSNIGFMGYPVISSLFGQGAAFYVTIFVLFFQLFVWSYGVHLISGEQRFRFTWRILLRPCIVSSLLAFLIFFADIRVPPILGQACKFVGDMTSPLAMVVIGCSLAQLPLKSVFGRWQAYVLVVIKMVLIPVAAYFLLRNFLTDPYLLGVTVVILSMPVATNTTIICYQQGADAKLASAGVFLTTLFSVISIPTMMMVLFG